MILDAAVDRPRSTLYRTVFIGEEYLHQLLEPLRVVADVIDDLHRLSLGMLSRQCLAYVHGLSCRASLFLNADWADQADLGGFRRI